MVDGRTAAAVPFDGPIGLRMRKAVPNHARRNALGQPKVWSEDTEKVDIWVLAQSQMVCRTCHLGLVLSVGGGHQNVARGQVL